MSKKKKTSFFYLTLDDYEVYSENPNNSNDFRQFESFVPTIENLMDGYVVFATYKTYDSFSTDEELSYFVLDLYPDKEKAIEAGENLIKKVNEEDRFSKEKDNKSAYPKFANNDEIKYIPCIGWGTDFQEIIVKKVEVKQEPDYIIMRRF
jgi:hypothetical protein